MKIVSNELKIALKQPTMQRKGRILVNGNYYEVYNVEYYADAYNEGNVIGNAIASQLDFDLPYMDKFETFKYYDGVWTGAEYEYVDMGTFTVFDEQDEDEFNKHITAFDNLIKFNKQFEDVGGYPKTLYQELKNICSQAEVELQNTSIPNGNFSVENNQFVEGENLKTVLKAIEQISGTYGIIKNDKLVLQLKNQTSEKINKNEHEPITWKRRTYGINQLILGMEDVQGEYVLRQDDEDIAINGIHKLVINDNPFVYTQQKREQVIDELFNQVKGFGYVPYDLKMEWLNYMDIGDTISIDGIETLILRMYGKSPKSLESEMSAPAIIDSAVEYSNNTFSLAKRVSRTEFGVDKNAKEIQGIIETTETIQKEINPIKDESGSNIKIEDASNNPLTYLEIEGKSTQEVRSGKNLLNTPYTVDNKLTDTATRDDYFNVINQYVTLEAGKTYTFSVETDGEFGTGYGDTVEVLLLKEPHYTYYITMPSKTFTFIPNESGTYNVRYDINQNGRTHSFWNFYVAEESSFSGYEQGGVSPSPDYPSEIESVGYENLFPLAESQTINGVAYTKNKNGTFNIKGTATANAEFSFWMDYKKCKLDLTSGKKYYIGDNIVENPNVIFQISTWNGVVGSATWVNTPYQANGDGLINSNYNTVGELIRFTILIEAGKSVDLTNVEVQLEEGETPHSFVPYSKYGIEVKTVGKNLFNKDNIEIQGSSRFDANTGDVISVDDSRWGVIKNYIPTYGTNKLVVSGKIVPSNWTFETVLYNKDKSVIKTLTLQNKTSANDTYVFSSDTPVYYIRFACFNTSYDKDTIQIECGETVTEYQSYQEITSVMQLNAPLRSLPNGVKDIAYIKNNKLYVDRKIGNLQITKDRIVSLTNPLTYSKEARVYKSAIDNIKASDRCVFMSNTFEFRTTGTWGIDEIGIFAHAGTSVEQLAFRIPIDEDVAFFDTNPTYINYELATPVKEELGEIEMLKTLKGYNNISTTDDLLPIINLTYVRDTVIADYVENHVTELKLTENEIKASVESVSSSVDGLNTTINRVEEITNDNSQVINVISTNIDKTSGEVREVTTTTGFTFNAKGMTINDGSGFKAEHTSKGTYYKDGESITGQYTKDGSKQKDLELFGTYSYGKESIDDTPMFVGQLFTNENGEEGFGHFYNGGDY